MKKLIILSFLAFFAVSCGSSAPEINEEEEILREESDSIIKDRNQDYLDSLERALEAQEEDSLS
jgi:hypothetical protein